MKAPIGLALALVLSACSGDIPKPAATVAPPVEDIVMFWFMGYEDGMHIPQGPSSDDFTTVTHVADGEYQLVAPERVGNGSQTVTFRIEQPETCRFVISIVAPGQDVMRATVDANLISEIAIEPGKDATTPFGANIFHAKLLGKPDVVVRQIGDQVIGADAPMYYLTAAPRERLQKAADLFRAEYCPGLSF